MTLYGNSLNPPTSVKFQQIQERTLRAAFKSSTESYSVLSQNSLPPYPAPKMTTRDCHFDVKSQERPSAVLHFGVMSENYYISMGKKDMSIRIFCDTNELTKIIKTF